MDANCAERQAPSALSYVAAASARGAPPPVSPAARVATGRRRRRRRLTGRGAPSGACPPHLLRDLDPVVPELVAPVLAVERPDHVLVVGADLVGAVHAVPAVDDLLLLLDLFFQLALLAGQDFVLDLDDALDELRQLAR